MKLSTWSVNLISVKSRMTWGYLFIYLFCVKRSGSKIQMTSYSAELCHFFVTSLPLAFESSAGHLSISSNVLFLSKSVLLCWTTLSKTMSIVGGVGMCYYTKLYTSTFPSLQALQDVKMTQLRETGTFC